MHNIKEIRNDIEAFKKALSKRFLDIDIDKILSLDESNREFIQQRELLEKEKIKKEGEQGQTLKLVATKDILMEASKIKTRQFVVGFAAETQNLIESAQEKLRKKKLYTIL